MERIDHARKGRNMTIKENFYIHLYKRHNKLIDEQRTHDDNHANILYDTAIAHIDTPTYPFTINTATASTRHASRIQLGPGDHSHEPTTLKVSIFLYSDYSIYTLHLIF
jgi:hypothetical protein